ncbi:uncharacterized protein LOC125035245 [Penaeus chinensis]|uniref:uncharacterized protein LOC125035245 n=1 Tax=Penaeus chinensis TaxID=139456 RepID=UPI001FB57EE8|nr:uncharacterized protein LOC125035245 [Penaeus chinensis]
MYPFQIRFSAMKAVVTLVVVVLLVATMMEEAGGHKRNGRGGGPGGRGRDRRGLCIDSLCGAAEDADTCSDCARNVRGFKQQIRTCSRQLSVRCHNMTTAETDSLTTCLTDAISELSDCF